MKPLHVSLLVVGAALAGGLAVKMSQPPAIAVAPIAPVMPVPAKIPAKSVTALVVTPYQPHAKPSPFAEVPTPAPRPVYVEPFEIPIRKNKPILIAKALPEKAPPAPETPAPPLLPPVPYQAPPTPVEVAPAPRQVTLRTGFTIPVRLAEPVSSDHSAAGDSFTASLAEPLVVDGLVIAERGARVTGRIVDVQKGSWFGGASSVELELASIISSDGQRVAISTDPWTQRGSKSSTETIIQFRLASKVTIRERQL